MLKFYREVIKVTGPTLVGMLDERLARKRSARSHKVLHASALTYEKKAFCPREYALLDVLKAKQPDEFISTALKVCFDNGEDLHDRVRNDWLSDVAVGDWRCAHCGKVTAFSKRPIRCKHCGTKGDFIYEEMRFQHQETGVDGGIDFIVDMGQPKLTLVEIKSMDKDQFNTLKAPLAEHRTRTVLYLHLVDGSDFQWKGTINLEEARVLYISKGFGVKNEAEGKVLPFKEFVVKREATDVTPYLDKARELYRFRTEGGPLPCAICSAATSPRAKQCSIVKDCFSQKFANYNHDLES